MAASPNLLPWFETARIAAKYTQAAPAMARLLTMRPRLLRAHRVDGKYRKSGAAWFFFVGISMPSALRK
jgi:hypothetical protein